MSTAEPPDHDRVAIETPRGEIRAGTVVDRPVDATFETGPTRMVRVEIDGHIFEVPADDAQPP